MVTKLRLVVSRLARGNQTVPSEPAPHIDWSGIVEPFMWEFYNNPSKGSKRYGAARKQGIFHPSNGLAPTTGNCERKIVFDLLCAPRSATKIAPNFLRIFHNGHDRHEGLHQLFSDMAQEKYRGIVKYESDVPCSHPTIPLAGEADGIVHFDSGYRYVLDFKTIGDSSAKKMMGVETDQKYYYQLNTYLGLLREKTGYLVFENKSSQAWLGPWEKFRLDFDVQAYKQTEDYCRHLMDYVKRRQLPVFNQRVCNENIKFCAYAAVCEKARFRKITWEQLDQRPPELLERYWK